MDASADGRRIRIEHDIHRFHEGRALALRRVEVAAVMGFDTPSDGDVPCHARIDALAGALAERHLGRFFPATADGVRSICLDF